MREYDKRELALREKEKRFREQEEDFAVLMTVIIVITGIISAGIMYLIMK